MIGGHLLSAHLHHADFYNGVHNEMFIVSNALILLESEVGLQEDEDIPQRAAAIWQIPATPGLILHHCLMLLGHLPLHIQRTQPHCIKDHFK